MAPGRRCIADLSEAAAINEWTSHQSYLRELGTRNALDNGALKENNEQHESEPSPGSLQETSRTVPVPI